MILFDAWIHVCKIECYRMLVGTNTGAIEDDIIWTHLLKFFPLPIFISQNQFQGRVIADFRQFPGEMRNLPYWPAAFAVKLAWDGCDHAWVACGCVAGFMGLNHSISFNTILYISIHEVIIHIAQKTLYIHIDVYVSVYTYIHIII